MIEKTGDNTVNYSDPEARKSPNKEGVTQTGYNEQIVVDNKNRLIIAVDITTDGNNQKQLMPMIEKSEENIQKALNLTTEEFQKQYSDMDVLADYGYYSYDQVKKTEDKENKATIKTVTYNLRVIFNKILKVNKTINFKNIEKYHIDDHMLKISQEFDDVKFKLVELKKSKSITQE